MIRAKRRRMAFYLAMSAAILLVMIGVVMLGQTFTGYNQLSQERQDNQLREMASAADERIAIELNNIREDLSYVLGRRGFMQAEEEWAETGDAEDLLFRMQENLIAQNPLIHTILAIREGEIILSTNGSANYSFPADGEGNLQPCFAGNGTMYLALTAKTSHAEYAALIDLAIWYESLARVSTNDGSRLMLLGSREKLLLHEWMEGSIVAAVEELNENNCDIQAVRYMMTSRNSGQSLTATYHLTYPGDDFVHEMRMTVIPVEGSVNGYFIVGLTCDYDEIIRPMQAAVFRLIISGSMVVVGVLMIVLLLVSMVRRGRRQDQELKRLMEKNAETQKLLEKTQALAHHQRLETIGTLASSIAHEFNNLLTPIMGYSILTLEGLPEECEELADNVSEIYEASRKAKNIISRLSELSRKNEEMNFRAVSLEAVTKKTLQVAAPAQPPNVTTMICCEDECCVSGNETQLSQMLLNLILNAYHAMADRGGVLKLHLRREADAAVLTVEDNGSGIPEAALPHIFEPFYTTKEAGRGTGLGLAIVHQVAESHQGQIDVRSKVGEGTAFTLRFPLTGQESIADS